MPCPLDILLCKGKKAYRSPYWICREFPKADRIGNSFLVLLSCPSRRYDLGTTKKEVQDLKEASHPGFVVSFDNIDVHVQRRNMTMDSQNCDFRWINHHVIANRVSGAALNSSEPQGFLSNVSNLQFPPTLEDQKRQRHNYIILTSRILVNYFKALSPLAEGCIQHIPHKYSEEMSQKTNKVNQYAEVILLFSKQRTRN